MATIKIEISKRGKANEPKELKIRFSYKRGCVFRLRSGIFVKEESWNVTKEKVVIPRMVTKQQKELKQLQSKIDSLLNYLKTESITAPKNADTCFPHALFFKKMMLENQRYSSRNLVNCGARSKFALCFFAENGINLVPTA